MAAMLNVLVTMRFDRTQLDRLQAVSPEISVSQADPDAADDDGIGVDEGGLVDVRLILTQRVNRHSRTLPLLLGHEDIVQAGLGLRSSTPKRCWSQMCSEASSG